MWRRFVVSLYVFGAFAMSRAAFAAEPTDSAPTSTLAPAPASEPSGRTYDGPGQVESAGVDEIPVSVARAEEAAPPSPEATVAATTVPAGPSDDSSTTTAGPEALDPGTVPNPSDGLPPRSRHKLVYRNLFAARYNPLGLVNDLTLGWRMQLLQKKGALYEDSYVAVKGHAFVNPAFIRVGPLVEIQPLAVLNLSASYDYVGYLRTFDQFQSFPSPTYDYREAVLSDLGKQNTNYATGGHLVTLSALAQGKVWRIAVRNNVKFYYADFNLRDGDRVYYDQTLDILEPNEGWAMTNDLDVLGFFDNGLRVGARYTVTQAFYQRKHFLPGEVFSRPNGPTHRVGPAMVYQFYDRPDRRFNKPSILLLSQWWVRHRYRTGEASHPAIPYLVVGFVFEGDLLPDPRKHATKRKGNRR